MPIIPESLLESGVWKRVLKGNKKKEKSNVQAIGQINARYNWVSFIEIETQAFFFPWKVTFDGPNVSSNFNK